MRRPQLLVCTLFVGVTLLVSTLAVCDAHVSPAEHPDCARCVVATSSRREDGTPGHVPAAPHHCPEHACGHLHAPFVVGSGIELPPLVAFCFFLAPPLAHEREPLLDLLRPPQA